MVKTVLTILIDRDRPLSLLANLLAREGLTTITVLVQSAHDLPPASLWQDCDGVVIADYADHPHTSDAACYQPLVNWINEVHASGKPILALGNGSNLFHLAAYGNAAEVIAPQRSWLRIRPSPQAANGAATWALPDDTRVLLWRDHASALPHEALPWLELADGRNRPRTGRRSDALAYACRNAVVMAFTPAPDERRYADWLAAWRADGATPTAGEQTLGELAHAGQQYLAGSQRLCVEVYRRWLRLLAR